MCERLLALLQEQQEVTLGMTFLDGKNIKDHHKATGTSKKGSFEERDHRKSTWPLSRQLGLKSLRDSRQACKGAWLCSSPRHARYSFTIVPL